MPLLLEMAILKIAAITELATYCFQSQSQFRGTEKPCRTIRKALEKLDLKQLQELSCSRKSLRNHPKILEPLELYHYKHCTLEIILGKICENLL